MSTTDETITLRPIKLSSGWAYVIILAISSFSHAVLVVRDYNLKAELSHEYISKDDGENYYNKRVDSLAYSSELAALEAEAWRFIKEQDDVIGQQSRQLSDHGKNLAILQQVVSHISDDMRDIKGLLKEAVDHQRELTIMIYQMGRFGDNFTEVE
jgi:hypothetical protein